MMKSSELVAKHIDVVKNYKTVYMWGVFGAPVTETIIAEKSKQYPSWYTPSRQAFFRSLIGKGYFGFDCVNLTKGILWGWNGNKNLYYGGAKYNCNGVPDVSADGMLNKCTNHSTDFSNIQIGEGLWLPGHWGIYIGDGLAVECTPAWDNCCQITAVGNIGAKSGYHTRNWTKHCRIPYIEYDTDKKPDPEVEEAKKIIKEKAGLIDATIKYIAAYKYGEDLLKKLAKAMK